MSRPQSPAPHPPPYIDSNFFVHDWTSFFHPQDFEAPRAEDGIDAFSQRLSRNFSGFFGNYVIVCGMCIVFACIAQPVLFLGIMLVGLMFKFRDSDVPFFASIVLSLMLTGGTTFLWSIFVGVAVILVHSMLHLPVHPPPHEQAPPVPASIGAVRNAWSSAASILVGQAMGLRQRIAASLGNNGDTPATPRARGGGGRRGGRTPPPPQQQQQTRHLRHPMPARVRTEPPPHMQQPQQQYTDYHVHAASDGEQYDHAADYQYREYHAASPSPPPPPQPTVSLASASMDFLMRRRTDNAPLQPLHEE